MQLSNIRHRSGELKTFFNFGANNTKLLNQITEATQAPIAKCKGAG